MLGNWITKKIIFDKKKTIYLAENNLSSYIKPSSYKQSETRKYTKEQ